MNLLKSKANNLLKSNILSPILGTLYKSNKQSLLREPSIDSSIQYFPSQVREYPKNYEPWRINYRGYGYLLFGFLLLSYSKLNRLYHI